MKINLSTLIVFALFFIGVGCTPEDNPGANENNVVVTAIKLSTNVLTIEKGEESTLSVTFTPSNVTDKSIIWISLDDKIATVKDGVVKAVSVGSTEIVAKCGGEVRDKCKVTVVISATGISLDETSLDLTKGKTTTLTATVTPSDATDKVIWETSDGAVATVDEGIVTAVGVGEATITAKAGTYKADCKVTVTVISVPDRAVDLGIVMTREDGSTYTLYWADANLTANGLCDNPEDYGDYYAWGEVEPKSIYRPANYKFYNGYDTTGTEIVTKYNFNLGMYGKFDGKTVLEPEDDAAHVVLGGKWRMPTGHEIWALWRNCVCESKTQNGVNGYTVSAFNGNSIFLPAAGYWGHSGFSYGFVGSHSFYWSSSLSGDAPYAHVLVCQPFDYGGSWPRWNGLPIRPVTE